MNIRQISYSLFGAFMFAGALSGCTDSSYKENAKEKAVKYLNGNELLRAEIYASKQKSEDGISSAEVNYWDSLLIDAKSKESYLKGLQFVKDSVNKKFYKREKYRQKFDTIVPNNFIDSLKKEVANYKSAEEYIKLRNNAPKKDSYANEFPQETHYWNLIRLKAEQKEAYNKGANEARKEILK